MAPTLASDSKTNGTAATTNGSSYKTKDGGPMMLIHLLDQMWVWSAICRSLLLSNIILQAPGRCRPHVPTHRRKGRQVHRCCRCHIVSSPCVPSTSSAIDTDPNAPTRNNIIVHERMCDPENEELFNTAVKEYGHLGWSKVRDRLVSELSIGMSNIIADLQYHRAPNSLPSSFP